VSEFFNPEEEDELAAQQKAAKTKRDQELDDIRVLLKLGSGRRFIHRVMSEGKIFHSTFSTDAPTAAFLEGARNLSLKFMRDVIEAEPSSLITLLTEGQDIAK
jgi:hypothetical protein